MVKKTFTYINYNDEKVTETCWFNISKSELATMTTAGNGLKDKIQKVVESQNKYEILSIIKEIILLSYGEKTADGRSFMKTPEITKKFECSEPFNMLYTSLFSDAKAFADFIRDVMPKDLLSEVDTDTAVVEDLPIGIK